jgi:hypothetical protein
MPIHGSNNTLHEHVIFMKTRAQALPDVRALNLWGYELEDVSIISQLVNLETLSLPINKITTLAPFASCRNLKSLLLRRNSIVSFDELEHLRDLRSLRTLSLSENPIAEHPNYREIVIRKLPQIRTLDDMDVAVKTMPVRMYNDTPIPREKSRRNTHSDAQRSGVLTAVLSLIPELSHESLHIVLEAIQARCT